MLEKQLMRDMLLQNEFQISYVLELPVIDLKPLVCLEPPGMYVLLDDVVGMLKLAKKRLAEISPHPKKEFCVAMASDFTNIVLARIPSPQLESDFEPESGKQSQTLSQEKKVRAEAKLGKDALAKACEINKSYVDGKIAGAEDLQKKLCEFDEPQKIQAALKQLGKKEIEVIIDNRPVNVGGGEPFPAMLTTEMRYEMQILIDTGVNLREKVIEKTEIVGCQTINEFSRELVLGKVLIPSNYLREQDGSLLVAAQLAEKKVLVEATLSIDSFTGKIVGMTIFQILNVKEIVNSLRSMMMQECLPFIGNPTNRG